MGFCIFSNVAIAALYARKTYGAERVAVVDFDVHHGNGTQDIFWSDKDLLFASTHQMPLYPGTGACNEIGVGNIFNAPLRPGDGGDVSSEAFQSRILPALNNFAPDLVLISAGFDAHKDDPLANFRPSNPILPGRRPDRRNRRKHATGVWFRCSKAAITWPARRSVARPRQDADGCRVITPARELIVEEDAQACRQPSLPTSTSISAT